MSFKIKYYEEKIIATFSNAVKVNEIRNAFVEVFETTSIISLNYLILDFSTINSYSIPDNYLDRLKMITHFSTTWNENIKVVVIASNTEIRDVVSGIIESNRADLKWEYFLFDDQESVHKWNPSIIES